MNKNREQAWKECLILWETLSILPDINTYDDGDDLRNFKRQVLIALGIGDKQSGCPMCELYAKGIINCNECPINIYEIKFNGYDKRSYACEYSSPYTEYGGRNPIIQKHHQEYAEEFYKYLIKVAKHEKYIPDCRFKNW